MKTCKGPCARVLPLDAFTPRKHMKDGRHSKCRECVQVYWRAWNAGKLPPKPAPRRSPTIPPERLVREPALRPVRRQLVRTAAAALVEHGVEDYVAELVVDLILRGKVPHLAVELETGAKA